MSIHNIDLETIKKRARDLESYYGQLGALYKRFREIYFLDNIEHPKGQGVDEGDWKITASPSGRNAVTGMKRLMDTSEVHITVKDHEGKQDPSSDKIEAGLKKMLQVSGERRRARIEKDANLSSILFGPVVLMAESVDDLITVQKNKMYRNQLERIKTRTPFLIRCLNAENSFAEWGDYGMISHLWKYSIRGAALKERWGLDEQDIDDDKEYTVWDYIDSVHRVVWSEGIQNSQGFTIYEGEHGLSSMNIVVRYAGGTSLFTKPEEMMQPFLYAKAKGEWDKRENLWWTYLFTAIYMQGLPGPLLIVDPDDVNADQPFQIDFSGGIRKIVAKATPTNLPVIDSDVLQLKQQMDEVAEDSTIRGTTLGENISGSTFSALSMLSNAGKLPMVDPQEAVEQAFTDIFLHILERIKEDGIQNNLIPPQDIPENLEIEVELEVKLPQDDLRNAQVASNLGPLVSKEWKRSKLLQIGNSDEMDRQVAVETLSDAMLQNAMQDPEIMKQLVMQALGIQPQQPPQQPAGPGGPGAMPGEGQQPPMPPEGAIPGEAPQGPMPMEAMPQGGPMIPPGERM